jgi:minor curlin subunit
MTRLNTIAAAALFALSLGAPAAAQPFGGSASRAQPVAARTANEANVVQNGDRNAVGAAQIGRGNRLGVIQNGNDGAVTIQQNGNYNTASVIQQGHGQTATVSQTGDNNGACVLQIGRGATANVTQTGGERSAIVVTPRGTREMRSQRATRLCGF